MTNLEELLMPLAQRMLPAVPEDAEGKGAPERYDPRFEALRMRRSWPSLNLWSLDASLGAIVRAAVACGMWCDYLSLDAAELAGGMVWVCGLRNDKREDFQASGDTPEEAMACCLVAMVEGQDKEG